MSATELALALVALAAFSAFALDSENAMAEALKDSGAQAQKTFAAQKCGAAIGMVYAQAGGKLAERIDCSRDGRKGKWGMAFWGFSPGPVQNSSLRQVLMEVNNHYGQGTSPQP